MLLLLFFSDVYVVVATIITAVITISNTERGRLCTRAIGWYSISNVYSTNRNADMGQCDIKVGRER